MLLKVNIRMIVCHCGEVTDEALRRCIRRGARTLSDLTRATGCCDDCCGCEDAVLDVLRRETMTDPRNIDLTKLDEAVEALVEELHYQDGVTCKAEDIDVARHPMAYLTLIRATSAKADAAMLAGKSDQALHEIRKLTALGLRVMLEDGIKRR